MKRMLGFAILASVAAFIALGAQNTGASDPLKDPHFVWREGERLVALRLKDPDSARFTGWVSDTGESLVACGEVSAHNSFGGYAEPVRWRLNAKEGVAYLDTGAAGFASAWREECTAPPVLNKG